MLARTRAFFDPLRLHCLFNILGDVFIVFSGVHYGNPVRAVSAILGSTTHLFGIAFSKKKFFGFQSADLVMGVVFICGCLYTCSGSNIFGFEESARYTEVFGGFCVSSAALSVMLHKSKLASVFFTVATISFSFSAFEVLIVRGEGDWFVLTGSLMFFIAGLFAAFIKKEKGG